MTALMSEVFHGFTPEHVKKSQGRQSKKVTVDPYYLKEVFQVLDPNWLRRIYLAEKKALSLEKELDSVYSDLRGLLTDEQKEAAAMAHMPYERYALNMLLAKFGG